MSKLAVLFGDNMEILPKLPSNSVDLLYIDPPFNTGKQQERTCLKTVASASGDRIGFNGRRYQTVKMGTLGYADIFTDYIEYIEPRLIEAYRLLTDRGSLFFHIDYRESHYCKILLDMIFGRRNFMNEIIWSYDYGARSKKRWSCKHDTILWYTKNHLSYIFNYDEIDRIPYMTPELVGEEKAEKGKTPTDVWWNTIVSPIGREKTGYATQKPRRILERIIAVHSYPDSLVGDFFAGSGSFGAAAYHLKRDCFLMDKNEEAIEVMKKRFTGIDVEWHLNRTKRKRSFAFFNNRSNQVLGNTSSRYASSSYAPSQFAEIMEQMEPMDAEHNMQDFSQDDFVDSVQDTIPNISPDITPDITHNMTQDEENGENNSQTCGRGIIASCEENSKKSLDDESFVENTINIEEENIVTQKFAQAKVNDAPILQELIERPKKKRI